MKRSLHHIRENIQFWAGLEWIRLVRFRRLPRVEVVFLVGVEVVAAYLVCFGSLRVFRGVGVVGGSGDGGAASLVVVVGSLRGRRGDLRVEVGLAGCQRIVRR